MLFIKHVLGLPLVLTFQNCCWTCSDTTLQRHRPPLPLARVLHYQQAWISPRSRMNSPQGCQSCCRAGGGWQNSEGQVYVLLTETVVFHRHFFCAICYVLYMTWSIIFPLGLWLLLSGSLSRSLFIRYGLTHDWPPWEKNGSAFCVKLFTAPSR